MEFNGDIIITDPCYVIKDEEWGDILDELALGERGLTFEWKGMKFLSSDTGYGDWACTTFNLRTGKAIGQFCADAGLVAVFSLEEVLKYDPTFNYHIERPWTTTWIKNFHGEASIVYFTDQDEVRVVGNGNICFMTTQTGF